MNIKKDFDGFIKAAYPNGVIPDQERQLKMAFYGGAMTAVTNVISATSLTPPQFSSYLSSLLDEAEQYAKSFRENPTGSRTPTMDRFNLHGASGYANDPNTNVAIASLQARWKALSPEDRARARAIAESESLKTPDGPGR
jgi:hypothetical protein